MKKASNKIKEKSQKSKKDSDKVKKTGFCSWKCGTLAKGCQQCVLGQKMVVFVTGLCARKCFYCPLADTKKDKDVIFANEWQLKDENDTSALIKEAGLTEARGAGITGGDPLAKVRRTTKYIRLLKKKFGKNFHIHLYTILESIDNNKLKMLYDSGLDEIRVHPNFFSDHYWNRIELLQKYKWRLGVEIPAIPGMKKETMKMIDYFKDKIDFLNINELEISDSNAQRFMDRKFLPKNRTSYGISGSEKLAKELLRRYCGELPVHYCTTQLKDKVQMAARIKRRAKNVAQKFDVIDEDGMLTRGAIYIKETLPGFGYRKKLEQLRKSKAKSSALIKTLKKTMAELCKKYKIKKEYITVDNHKFRILTSPAIAGLIKEKGLTAAVVTEYPTWDMTEVEVEFFE